MPYTYEYPHPAVTVDTLIFTVRDDALKVLLIKRAQEPFRGVWAIPGGFVNIDEDLEAAARRELQEETGVCGGYLEQLYTYGAPDRDPRERVISVAYYALLPFEQLQPRAASDAEDVGWFALDALPALAFDHPLILEMARQRLAARLDDATFALQLMPERFTLSELQRACELLGGAAVDKRNFRKRMLTLDVIEATEDLRRDGAHRPAQLYRARRSRP